ncbi:cucumisin-like [Phoenix dactylifera]|uniref:Cucumisin-like n=1 Tax=Phoenix dactylifera TaxID=42345 RepID=A0A8B9A2H8_PHODC|nr:cucumisin-like [Phoenix dactylifera]
MATKPFFLLYTLVVASFLICCHCTEERKVHIVYMGEKPKGGFAAKSMHHSILEAALGSSSGAKESLVYSYGRSFNGFAARLTDKEATRIQEMDGVVSVLPNTIIKLHTTKSWDFMGLTLGGTVRFPSEGDVIVGLLDTGIWPESDSFSDKDMGPPPAKWKGICQGSNFTCNNKIIGGRYYNSEGIYASTDFKSPRDSEGHGTHTSSTAAGALVPDTSYFGLAFGTARGGVPKARIAMYKVCWSFGCASADILAAFDDAIADGVDILSVSLGGPPRPFFRDPIAIGSFHAMKNGILTANSAGNSGPDPRTVTNVAPWTITVAASSIDRKFIAKVALGNGQIFIGNSINRFALVGTYSLIYGGGAPNISAGASGDISKYCFPGSLNSYKTEHKIVLCDSISDGSGVLMAHGLGVIMSDSEYSDLAFSYPLPATVISVEDGAQILAYIQSTSNPFATILMGETIEDVMAPTVVSFSSRGPNTVVPDMLKPDLTAPGVDILAAWSPVAPPSVSEDDPLRVKYNVISGTSMSCPHVSGAAAYIKSAHPGWSPAAIKSALMTTATVMDPRKNADAEFAYGAGQIDPRKALTPGLIFDASEKDYVDFLCKQGYNTSTLRLVTGDSSTCPNTTTIGNAWGLNYPSFALSVIDGQRILGVFPRTVTNVGAPNSTYYASWAAPYPLTVSVTPSLLSFSSVGETKSFTVTVRGGAISQQFISGYIVWRDATHTVRMPLVVYTTLPPDDDEPMAARVRRSFDGSSRHHNNGILGAN